MNLRIAFGLFSLVLVNLSPGFAGSSVSTPLPPSATSSAQATEEAAAAMQAVTTLESWVLEHPNATAAEVEQARPELLQGLTLREDANPLLSLAGPEDPLGVPSFLLGCTLGIAGVVLAYIFSDKDQTEAKKALNGCIFQTVVLVVGYIGFYAYIFYQFGL